MLYITFIEELEKIAKGQVGTTLDLKVNPYDLGIHAKREGSDAKSSYRPMAYTMGVPTAAAGGLAAGGLTGAFTEGKMTNVLTPKGRKRITKGIQQDLKTIPQGVPKALRLKAAADPVLMAKKIALKKATGTALTPGEDALFKNVSAVAKRRLGNIPKGMFFGALGAGALKGLYNVGSFETARAVAPKVRKRRG